MDLEITVQASLDEFEINVDVYIGSDEEINERLYDEFITEYPEIEDNEDLSEGDIEYTVTDWQDLEDCDSLKDELSQLAEYTGDLELEVLEAAYACGVSFDTADEAYQGEYADDEKFAEEMAESLGLINNDAQWPYYCIDWEHAARELMHDYSEDNGHYFRCM